MISHSQKKQPTDGFIKPNSSGLGNSSEPHGLSRKTASESLASKALHNYSSISLFSSNNIMQPKLSVNAPGDKYEQEADTVAGNVQHSLSNGLSQTTQPFNITPVTQTPEGVTASASLSDKIVSSAGTGKSMDRDTRNFMSQQFRTDLSKVKIHTGDGAEQMNDSLSSRAFTVGNDIYFNKGEYQPGSSKGDHLLAHELTHVVQQGQGSRQIQKDDADTEKAAAEEAKKKTDFIATIKTYGVSAIEDGDVNFTSAELDLVNKAITGLPASDKASIKGAKIIRVSSLGPKTAGRYSNTQGYDGTTVTDEQKIELSNRAFGVTSAAESIRIITHEIGHAIAAMPYRLAMTDEINAGAKSNKLIEEANVAVEEFNTANDESNTAIDEFNNAVLVYNAAIKGTDTAAIATAKADMQTKRAASDKLTAARAAKETVFNTKKAASDAQKLIVATKEKATKSKIANIDDLKTDAATKLTAMQAAYKSAGSTIGSDDAESSDYRASLTTAEDAITTFYNENALVDVEESAAESAKSVVDNTIEDRNRKREALNVLNPKNTIVGATATLEAAQDNLFKAATVVAFNKSMNLSVRKFYDLVVSNGISPALTTYAAENWPHKPEEFYAEAYSFFVTKPKDLETYSKVLFDWFKAGSYK